MKKMRIIPLLLLAVLMFSACGGKTVMDGGKLAKSLRDQICFMDQISEIKPDMAKKLYELDDAKSLHVYVSSGATAEELAVIETESASKAKKVVKQLEKRIESQKNSFQKYTPGEVKHLDKAILERKDQFVIFCVSSDDKAEEVVKKNIEKSIQ